MIAYAIKATIGLRVSGRHGGNRPGPLAEHGEEGYADATTGVYGHGVPVAAQTAAHANGVLADATAWRSDGVGGVRRTHGQIA